MGPQNKGSGRNNSNGNDGSAQYEVIKPITRVGFLTFQILQTLTILLQSWVLSKGDDNWLANTMPETGYLVMGAIFFQLFMFLWLQKLNVSNQAK